MLESVLAKHNRRKCINLLEKITKNLFKMFRDPDTTQEMFIKKCATLNKKLMEMKDVHLDTEYHRETRKYITQLFDSIQTITDFDNIRSNNMTSLNRLQKIKNTTEYKRSKHISEAEKHN